MNARLTTYLFRDGHFAPSGDTVVCVADRATVEAALGRGQMEVLLRGGAVYTDNATKLDYIGVWGVRSASRFRRFLRECGFEIVIDRQRPPNVRLRYFTHHRRRKLNRDQKQAKKVAQVATFAQQYARKAQRGVEPNDRRYDRDVETAVKRMPAEDLDRLLCEDDHDLLRNS